MFNALFGGLPLGWQIFAGFVYSTLGVLAGVLVALLVPSFVRDSRQWLRDALRDPNPSKVVDFEARRRRQLESIARNRRAS